MIVVTKSSQIVIVLKSTFFKGKREFVKISNEFFVKKMYVIFHIDVEKFHIYLERIIL